MKRLIFCKWSFQENMPNIVVNNEPWEGLAPSRAGTFTLYVQSDGQVRYTKLILERLIHSVLDKMATLLQATQVCAIGFGTFP